MTDPNRADLELPTRETWSCTVLHLDGAGNPVPCPDELHVNVPEPAPRRRFGCAWLAAVLVLAWLLPRPMCRNYGGWHPFEDETGFGYMDWVCQLPRGHRGDHWGTSS